MAEDPRILVLTDAVERNDGSGPHHGNAHRVVVYFIVVNLDFPCVNQINALRSAVVNAVGYDQVLTGVLAAQGQLGLDVFVQTVAKNLGRGPFSDQNAILP